jgi:hypothetical protein
MIENSVYKTSAQRGGKAADQYTRTEGSPNGGQIYMGA